MSKKFYKDIKIIVFCRVCHVQYYPPKGSVWIANKLCRKHRYIYYDKFREWLNKLPPEKRSEYKQVNYLAWQRWVKANAATRRAQALASYHKNKHKHVARKHRKVVK